MTESTGSVRATARVGGGPPLRHGIATLEPHRRPGYLGSIHVLQLLAVETIVIAVAAVSGLGLIPAAIGGAGAAVVLALTLGRRNGRWWLEHRAMSWRLHRRDGMPVSVTADDPRLVALRLLAPGVRIDEVAGTDDAHVAVARDSAGWYAVAEVVTGPGVRDQARPAVPLDALATALADADQSGGAVVQVVIHTVPAAAGHDEASKSYRDLQARYGPMHAPVEQTTWITVRLDAIALAEVGADLPDHAPDLVAALLRQLTKTLRRAGLPARLLDRDGLLDALDRSCDLTPRPGAGYHTRAGTRPTPPREDWHGWHSGRLGHRSYWLRNWPSVAQAGALLDWFTTIPAAFTSVSLTLAPNGTDVDIRCLARLATTPDRLRPAADALRTGARSANAELFPLDGEQRPAVYATAPTGGGPR